MANVQQIPAPIPELKSTPAPNAIDRDALASERAEVLVASNSGITSVNEHAEVASAGGITPANTEAASFSGMASEIAPSKRTSSLVKLRTIVGSIKTKVQSRASASANQTENQLDTLSQSAAAGDDDRLTMTGIAVRMLLNL